MRISLLVSIVMSGATLLGAEGLAQSPADAAVPETDAAVPETDAAARIYVNRCTGCHTIGRGNLTGPDLVAATKWSVPDLRLGVEKMQEKSGPMTPDEIDGVVRLLKDPDVLPRLAAEEARISLQYAAKLAPASPAEGGRLFDGSQALTNGGLACIACHRAGGGHGGGLGPDLLGVFTRTGATGLRSAVEKSQFKVMSAAYREHAVTAQEAMHLVAYFESIDANPPMTAGPPPLVGVGVVLALVAFLLTAVALRDRHQNAHGLLSRRAS